MSQKSVEGVGKVRAADVDGFGSVCVGEMRVGRPRPLLLVVNSTVIGGRRLIS